MAHTIYHVVTPSGTVTFLDEIGDDGKVIDSANSRAHAFAGDGAGSPWCMICKSEIGDESMELLRTLRNGDGI